jgi:hypothetical protein
MNNSQHKSTEAHRIAKKAIKDKKLITPKNCELCGDTEEIWRKLLPGIRRKFLIPHHWKGYDHPLDVWFVCYSCNALFRGQHNGKADKEEIRRIFEIYTPASKAARLSNLTRDQVNHRIKKGMCPGAKKLSAILDSNSGLRTDPWFIPKSLLPLPEAIQ